MTSNVTFWQRLRRTPYQVVAAVFMIFITLFVLGFFLIMAGSSSAILSYFESKPQLTVFFKDEKNQETIAKLVEKLKTTGKLSGSNYISKDQALAIYRQQNKNDPLLLEMVTADILPSSLEVTAINPRDLAELAEIVKKEPGVDEVVFQKDVVDTLISWTSTIRKVGLIFIIFLLISTFFILLTSIGMKIAFRKEEIEILKLVGATSWYIKKPFVSEGIVYGLSGAFLSFISICLIMLYLQPFAASFLRGIPQLVLFSVGNFNLYLWPFSLPLFLLLFVILILCGFMIGLVGSLFAVSRYMKY